MIIIKYIVFILWALLLIPIIIMGISEGINYYPAPSSNIGLFRYLLHQYKIFFLYLMVMISTMVFVTSKYMHMTMLLFLQNTLLTICIISLLLSIKYYRTRRTYTNISKEN